MRKRLSYADAVTLLGGSSPAMSVLDRLLGGALTVGDAMTGVGGLSLLDAKGEFTRLGNAIVVGLRDQIRGYGRFSRSERIRAAHAVIAVTAFFTAFDDLSLPFGLAEVDLTRQDQGRLVDASPTDRGWVGQVLSADVPLPAPDCPYERLLEQLKDWYAGLAQRFATYLTGLAVWERLSETDRRDTTLAIQHRLPGHAVDVYELSHHRLAVEVPEFALWVQRQDDQATRAELQRMGYGLRGLENLLRQMTSGQRPDQRRAELAAAYRAELNQPILGAGNAPAELRIPTLGEIYVDPMFKAKVAGTADRPADEAWWRSIADRDNLSQFLAGYLTSPDAAEAPLLILGQPGAGKSAFTRVLAARLPEADFLVVRVPLHEVPADGDVQDQIERAVRTATGEWVPWPDLSRSAGGALPVVLLDGFDELLQTTGVNWSDYLMKVADFQRREAVQQRQVAVVVTSRIAVVDRARLPDGSLVLRLEPFTPQQIKSWLDVWNKVNAAPFAARGKRPLPLELVRRYHDLAGQPLLLLMLALYDAQDNAVQAVAAWQTSRATADAGSAAGELLGTAELYERLLASFAEREVRRHHDQASEAQVEVLVESELMRLSIAAFGMFNRSRQWITEAELDVDLSALLTQPTAGAPAKMGFRAPLTVGQELVGRFFFIQRAQAQRDTQRLQSYEFLHGTFGEFLIARFTVGLLDAFLAREAAGTLPFRSVNTDDEMLYLLLGFAPLTSRGSALSFVRSLLSPGSSERHRLRDWLIAAIQVAVHRTDGSTQKYQPVAISLADRHAIYSLNLMLLALACNEPILASELFPDSADPAESLSRVSHRWQASTATESWYLLMRSITVRRTWTGDRRDAAVSLSPGDETVDPVHPFWIHNLGPTSEQRGYQAGRGFNHSSVDLTFQQLQLRGNLGDDILRHALEPLIPRIGRAVSSFAVHARGDVESVARSLITLWLVSNLQEPDDALTAAYGRGVQAVCSHAWGRGGVPQPASWPALTLLLNMLLRDVGRLPGARVLEWIEVIVRSEPFLLADGRHQTLVIECLLETEPETEQQRDKQAELIAKLVRWISAAEEGMPLDRRLRLRTWITFVELGRPELAVDLFGRHPDLLSVLPPDGVTRGDRLLRKRATMAAKELGLTNAYGDTNADDETNADDDRSAPGAGVG